MKSKGEDPGSQGKQGPRRAVSERPKDARRDSTQGTALGHTAPATRREACPAKLDFASLLPRVKEHLA